MTLEEAMAYINRLNYTQMPRGLERIRRLLAALDNPQRSMKFVHVAGTNGKGSTVAFISTILKEAGYVVGMYISPGLMRYNERMTVNGEEIADEDLIRYVEIIRQAIKRAFDGEPFQPNFFEITLAMALLYYRDRGCNIAVLEVGLGGRLDATNIIEAPEAAVIMTIDFDHMAQLGHTLSAIAGEKAGIIKRGTEVVIYPQGEEAAAVIETKCREQEVHLHKVDLSRLILRGHTLKLQHFDYKTYGGLTLALLGDHQVKNAAVAIETIEVLKTRGFDISEETMRAGLMHTVWPARFECGGG
jgi:dihydrofolate synthase/folylpolyglutamate synthase